MLLAIRCVCSLTCLDAVRRQRIISDILNPLLSHRKVCESPSASVSPETAVSSTILTSPLPIGTPGVYPAMMCRPDRISKDSGRVGSGDRTCRQSLTAAALCPTELRQCKPDFQLRRRRRSSSAFPKSGQSRRDPLANLFRTVVCPP